jgi:type III secretory pathway component EscV
MRELKLTRSQVWPGVVSAAMLAALAFALLPGHPTAVAVALAAIGAVGMLACTAPSAVRTLRRRRSMFLLLIGLVHK